MHEFVIFFTSFSYVYALCICVSDLLLLDVAEILKKKTKNGHNIKGAAF